MSHSWIRYSRLTRGSRHRRTRDGSKVFDNVIRSWLRLITYFHFASNPIFSILRYYYYYYQCMNKECFAVSHWPQSYSFTHSLTVCVSHIVSDYGTAPVECTSWERGCDASCNLHFDLFRSPFCTMHKLNGCMYVRVIVHHILSIQKRNYIVEKGREERSGTDRRIPTKDDVKWKAAVRPRTNHQLAHGHCAYQSSFLL